MKVAAGVADLRVTFAHALTGVLLPPVLDDGGDVGVVGVVTGGVTVMPVEAVRFEEAVVAAVDSTAVSVAGTTEPAATKLD